MERPRNNQFLEPERGAGIMGWALKQLVMWSVIGVIAYSIIGGHQFFRSSPSSGAPSADRSTAAPATVDRSRAPGDAALLTTNSLTLRAQSNGHVFLDAYVNGVPVRFMVDTGASWVSLTQSDAMRIGVAGSLDYSVRLNTFNGTVKVAPVTLPQVRIKDLVVYDVSAVVAQDLVAGSVLGQSFLKRLRSYEMQNGVLTLTW